METVTDLIFLGSKITVDSDCSHEIKRRLLLGRKTITNLYSVLKSWDIILLTKVHIVKAMVFPVVMYGSESWTINKAERWETDAVQVVLEKTLESPLVSKEIKPVHPKGNQPWIFIGGTDALTLILQPQKRWLIGKDPDAGKDWREEDVTEVDDRGWDGWMASPIQWTWVWANSWRSKGQGSLACCSPWGLEE